jgi:hypothetical protein
VRCPRCNRKEKVYALKAKPFHWSCCNADCGGRKGYRFSVITHTIFQDTKVSLRIWFKIGYLMLTAKKGVSSLQVRRVIFGEDSGTDWRTCWYICHRWRAAMRGDAFSLDGQIEVDETYVGGRNYNRHKSKRVKGTGGFTGKVAVIGAIARKGMVSLLKRGIMGQFHHVKKDYLPLYLNEFSYRHNNRKNPDAFGDLITTCGK